MYNPHDRVCSVSLSGYDDAGTTMILHTEDIPALTGKTISMSAIKPSAFEPAWVRIEGSDPLTGHASIYSRDRSRMACYNGIGSGGGEVGMFPKLEASGWTGIALVNLEPAEAVVTLSAYDNDGRNIAAEIISIPAHAKVIDNAENLFTKSIAGATYLSYPNFVLPNIIIQ